MRWCHHISPCIMTLSMIITLLLISSGCEHKALWMPESPVEATEVEYDWSEYAGDTPPGMTLYLYPLSTDENPWLFNLDHRGGIINVPEDTYRLISYNNNTDGILFRNTNDYTRLEVYTRNGNLLDGLASPYSGSLPSRAIEEPVVITPDMMWTTAVTEKVGGKRIILTPRRLTPRYSFTVTDVSNIGGVSKICAAISGLVGGVYLDNNSPSVYPVTLPSPARADAAGIITGSIITFGIPDLPSAENVLSLYIWLKDGSKHSFNFDVTGQIREAPDPMEVDITLSGLELPEVETSPDDPTGGIGVDVDSWHTVDIELKPIE